MHWSRREVLRALGLSAAGPALTSIAACGGGARAVRGRGTGADLDPQLVRAQLHELVDQLEARFPAAHGLAELRRRGGAAVDAGERGIHVEASGSAVFAVFDGRRWFEQATTDTSVDGLAAAARAVGKHAGGGRGGTRKPRKRADRASSLRIDPLAVPIERWLVGVDRLQARTTGLGGSRIVYRGAYLTVDESRQVFVGQGRDLSQRLVRTRAGVLFVAVTGATPSADEASRSGSLGLEVLEVPDSELAGGAERALALLTARPAPSGDGEVLLDPSVTALLGERCIAPAFEGHRWWSRESRMAGLAGTSIAPAQLTVIDDPAQAAGFGSYWFDDEGQTARAVTLIDQGVVREALVDRAAAGALGAQRTGHARRASPLEPAAPTASNLTIATGTASIEDLIASIDNGLLIEGGIAARSDPGSLRFALRAARAREIVGGRRTGRLFGAVDVIGELPAVLGSIRGMSTETATIASNRRVATSATAPAMIVRARVVGGR